MKCVFELLDLTYAFPVVAVTLALTKNLPDVRRGLTERCAAILHAYRKHCAAGQNSGQVRKSLSQTNPLPVADCKSLHDSSSYLRFSSCFRSSRSA